MNTQDTAGLTLQPCTRPAGKYRPQVAALCYRRAASGKRVLLITSRGTGRWVVPKGWPMDGLHNAQAALQEAWEEAGVRTAHVAAEPVGYFTYDKTLRCGKITPVRAEIFAAEVVALADVYPEDHQRRRAWFAPNDAADRVAEPSLQAVLRAM